MPSLPLSIVRPTASTPSIYEDKAVEQARRVLRFDPGLVRRLRTALFKHNRSPSDALLTLPVQLRRQFSSQIALTALTLCERFDSGIDGASKLIFKTAEGYAIESVLLRAATGRVALCVSSQIGCAAKCDFCATGRMGMAHDLSAAEILDQVAQANRQLSAEGRRVRNLVFMGMGEPLHNEQSVSEALDFLTSAQGFHHPHSRILLSTVGVADALERMAERFPRVNYAISLHAADQAVRERIIPLAKRYPLHDLRGTVSRLNALQSDRTTVMLEYLMLAGINDAPEDADRLIEWSRTLRVHLNLIPYNPVDDAPHLVGSDRATIERFGERLKAAGLPTTIRYSMGRDVDAACGQLVRRENRALARSTAMASALA
ncbi:23S rRNA (adenine(2503)-C(2))-methyltransferase RlmN [Botrimarina hoheduenensis]|uniref:Ribosomal RNA large subunit methyltransferase Cfr n=1 Tax=Botrimarina hoheduenensis TaxID=2528000 RepID=A0A5C5W689_9BACT|nr:23S rRNA (adenine(2503)-C(2))-methyltransferase RlmN [Botrimarina hoheduenensis]TWT46488.1 Ribosomal RNA large subunit methyltransferase Cfr [Botrimarina hoheduenensis]